MNRSPLLVPALLPALLLTACGGGESATTPPTPVPPSTPPPTSATPSQGVPIPRTAADGRDLAACQDGECEVVVRKGDILRFGTVVDTEPLTVVSAGDTFTVTDPSGFTASVGGAGGKLQTGSVQIEVGESAGSRTAIRISPRP
ncbi:hypothetical protein [Actinomadura sp. 6K520]|uniref:hypothetical protein n=1 Tax=Actinomadura sp. 6K520 TaxID=2530364 RepID=UPI00104EA273|nr:hypothetical protein [Actinomadura sp. 6K520]TDE28668.1 hypothetical protein E1289_21330 [Actinomadura sp. 6K520]